MGKYLLLCTVLAGCLVTGVRRNSLQRLSFEHYQMGTKFSIVFYDDDELAASAIARSSFLMLDSLNRIFSDYDPSSELNQLVDVSSIGKWQAVSEDMWTLLKMSHLYSEWSNGAFDITIGSLTRLWRKAFRHQELPDEAEIRRARDLVDFRMIDVDPDTPRVKILKQDMLLDAGAIAKGYAVDRLSEFLEQNGKMNYLVEGGGDLRAGLPPPGEKGWRIKLVDGRVLDLSGMAIATSGDTYRYLEWKGKRYSHLIDPRTGYGVDHGKTFTVMSITAVDADAWASILSIMRKDEIEEVQSKGLLKDKNILLPTVFTR